MSAESSRRRPAEILLVEDSKTDAILTREGFTQANVPVNLHHVESGEKSLEFLRKTGEYARAPTPDLVLLDLNLPVMDGREVLTEMVKDEALRHLPVVVLTTSADERDVRAMYDLRCSSYIQKPIDFNKFEQVIRHLSTYWFNVVALPPKSGAAPAS